MSQKPNRTCLTCGTPYYFCNCHHNADKYHWKIDCCTPMHWQVFMIALDLRDGKIDKREAKSRLKQVCFCKDDLQWCTESIFGILSPVFDQKKSQKKNGVEGGE